MQLFFTEPDGYRGSAHVVGYPEYMDFDGLINNQPYIGPQTKEQLFDFDETRTISFCISYAGDNYFYRIDLPPDADPIALPHVN